MRYINDEFFYEVPRSNWSKIEKLYSLDKDFIKKYQTEISKDYNYENKRVNPKDYHYFSLVNFDEICETLNLNPYDIQVKLNKNILIKPDFIENIKLNKENNLTLRKLIGKTNSVREYIINESLNPSNDDYFGEQEQYNKTLLNEHILDLKGVKTCLIFKENLDFTKAVFLNYKELPIIIINKKDTKKIQKESINKVVEKYLNN